MSDLCSQCGGRLVEGVCPSCEAGLPDTIRELGSASSLPVDETLDAVTMHGSGVSHVGVDTPRDPWATGHLILDEYEVGRLLGRGGMGDVYLVKSRISGQQHAVKRTRCVDPEAREALLAEVQTWRDLPEHPNLTACHFFRTLADDVLIFAEFVDGGSLDNEIERRGDDWTAREKLDIAIQFAFGLEAAHNAGYVHQDVKPGNVLLTRDGVVKVTDFGLARTQQLLASGKGPAGLTPAFCSPEQAFRDQPITAATDIWSWGVSVLELFVGSIRWQTGIFAAGVFHAYLNGKLDGVPNTMPPALAEILETCFKTNVEDRWVSSTALANALVAAWETTYGDDYHRPRVRPDRTSQARSAETSATDPRRWLDEVAPPAERLGDIGQLALFERAARKLRAGVDTGQFDRGELGELLIEKGKVHHRTNDWPGALDAFRQATRLVDDNANRAAIAAGEGRVHVQMRRFEVAEERFLRAIELLEEGGVGDDRLIEVWLDLADVRREARNAAFSEALERAEALLGDRDDARGRELFARFAGLRGADLLKGTDRKGSIPWSRRAVEAYEELILFDGLGELRPELASVYFNLGTGLTYQHDYEGAIETFERALRLYDHILKDPGGRRWSAQRAQCQINFGLCLRRDGDVAAAEGVLREAVGTFERLVHLEGRRDVEDKLTSAYLNLSIVRASQHDYAEAASITERVIQIRRRLVDEEGRDDMRNSLAATLGNHAYYLFELDENIAATASYEESIAIREGLLEEGKGEVRSGLSLLYVNRGTLHLARGLWEEALADSERARDLIDNRDSRLWVEALQLAVKALVELGRPDDAARLQVESMEQIVELSRGGVGPAMLADVQVCALAQEALVAGEGWSVAAESIANHPVASSLPKGRNLLALAQRAVATEASDAAGIVARTAQLLSDEGLPSDRLLLAYLQHQCGAELPSGFEEEVKREAARTGRVALRRILQDR